MIFHLQDFVIPAKTKMNYRQQSHNFFVSDLWALLKFIFLSGFNGYFHIVHIGLIFGSCVH